MADDIELIKACKKYNSTAQRALYYKYAPIMKAICIRYLSDINEAEDVLQESFMKVFTKIDSFCEKGSFEGWIKRIVINTALDHYNRNKKHSLAVDNFHYLTDKESYADDFLIEDDLEVESFTTVELFDAVKALPEPFRIVFNLFYVEGVSHKEISNMLAIEEKTSRTRAYRAKKMLQKYLLEGDIKIMSLHARG